MRKPQEFSYVPPFVEQHAPFGPYRGILKHAGDGDTIDVFIDAGLYQYPFITLRLKDVWSPDGTEIDDLMRQKILEVCPEGTPVAIETEIGPRSGKETKTFDRFVATVYLPTGENLNEILNAYHRELIEAAA